MKSTLTRTICTSLVLCGAFALAQSEGTASSGGAPGGHHHHHGPPKEAFAACTSKKSADACSFTGRNGEKVTGTCFAPDTEHPLACKPANAPDAPPPPPPAAPAKGSN